MRRALLLIWAGTALPFVLTIVNGGPDGWLPHLLFHPLYIAFLVLALWGARDMRRVSGSTLVRGLGAVLAVTVVVATAGHIGEFMAVLMNGGLNADVTVFETPLHRWSANATVPALLLGLVLVVALSVAAPLKARQQPVAPAVNRWSRSLHRWTSIVFLVVVPTALVLQDSTAVGVVGITAVVVLLLTGLQMNGRHYRARWRRRQARTGHSDVSTPSPRLTPERIG